MTISGIILAIIIFSIIVIFHELGHFLAAKACGVRVNEFSLGLGPTIVSFKKGETVYSLKALPFGGACAMEGEDSENSEDTEDSESSQHRESDGRAFYDKKCWQRILIVFMGPFFNFVMAYVFSVILLTCMGVDKPIVSAVTPGYAAEEAGIMAGDKLIAINNYRVHFFAEITIYNTFHQGEPVNIVYERNGERYSTVLVPKLDEESGRYLIGFVRIGERDKVSFIEALAYGFGEMKYQIYATYKTLGMLLTGGVGLDQVSGPVGIVSTIDNVYQQSVDSGIFYIFINMISIAILLSANLGVMNLLPIPALDGGRLFFLLIELIIGRRIPAKFENAIHMTGFILLLGVMVLVLFKDIIYIFI